MLPAPTQPAPALQAAAAGVQVLRLNSEDTGAWTPELLAYDVQAVPCLILLDDRGALRF